MMFLNCPYSWPYTIGALTIVSGAYSPQKETEIRSETVLASTYDAVSRPSDQTHVSVSLSILAIDDLDIKAQKFTTAGWLTFEWTDSRLTWNKTAKDDIEYIFAKPKTIWRPEVVLDNSIQDLGVIHDDELQLRIRYDGIVDWEPLVLFTTHCDVVITYYPYDQQKCALELVSWGYRYEELNLVHSESTVNLEDFVENGEWSIIDTHIEDHNLTDHTAHGVSIYPQLNFWIYLERRTDYYNLNVMMPVFLTSILVVLVFVVPVASGEKLSYVLTVQLSLAVLLTLVNSSLPSTSVSTSILGVYLGIVLIMAGMAVLLTVLIIMTHHREGEPEVSSFMFFIGRLSAKLTCTSLVKRSEGSLTKVVPINSDEKDATIEPVDDVTWRDISECLNRACFLMFLTLTVVMNLTFVILLGVGGKHYTP